MDRNFETGQAEASVKSALKEGSILAPQSTDHVSKVFLDGELARAMGHSKVNWSADHKPYVVTEPLPER